MTDPETRNAELLSVIETMNEAHKILMTEKNQLITELCDALEGQSRIPPHAHTDLIQRAREAAR